MIKVVETILGETGSKAFIDTKLEMVCNYI